MSTTLRGPPPVKKINSWVRPGVREVRARFLRPVSALIRLDLPTLERPANAISTPRIGGSDTAEPAAAVNSQSPVNRRRPASISDAVKVCAVMVGAPSCDWGFPLVPAKAGTQGLQSTGVPLSRE